MNCAEFQDVLPEVLEGSSSIEQQAHVQHCSSCSQIISEINLISQQARLLQACDEPSPRVWNSIEIALRQEGLIREPGEARRPVRSSWRNWTTAWLLPATAAFLVTFGVLRYEHKPGAPAVVAQSAPAAVTIPAPAKDATAKTRAAAHMSASDDEQLLRVVGTRSPAMRASYEKELRHVNEYIRDAEQSADANPNDEAAQQYLINAYDQKAVVYDLALDRSLQ